MRIAIMGAGGVGGYFGAGLVRSGADVTFIARGDHLAAMQEHGLRIIDDDGDIRVPVQATDDARMIDAVDLVVLAVKLGSSIPAIDAVKPLMGPDTAIVSFQNGVQKDDPLRRAFGTQAVMGGVAHVSAFIEAPGVIRRVGSMQHLMFGEFDGSRSTRTETFLAACEAAGFDAELSTDINRRIWQKFGFLVGLSGATSAMRQPIGPIRDNSATRAFLHDLVRETASVGRACGVGLRWDFARRQMALYDRLPAQIKASMCHDLEVGKPLELEWLSGAVADMGQELGVATPANRAVHDLLALHKHGRPD